MVCIPLFSSNIFPLLPFYMKRKHTQFYTGGSLGQGLPHCVASHSTMGLSPSTAMVPKEFYYIMSQVRDLSGGHSQGCCANDNFISETKAPETPGVPKECGFVYTHYKLFLLVCRDLSHPC